MPLSPQSLTSLIDSLGSATGKEVNGILRLNPVSVIASGNVFKGGGTNGTGTITATGQNSFAWGFADVGETVQASGDFSTAIGENVVASGPYGIAMGLNCTASGTETFAIGVSSTAGPGAAGFAIGTNCVASGGDCFAMGDTCTSSGTDSFTLGHICKASATNTIALGVLAQATTAGAIAVASVTGAAADHLAEASGTGSVIIGRVSDASTKTLTASATNAIAIGMDINNSTASTMQLGMADGAKLSLSTTGTGFNGTAAIAKPTVTGSKGANAALTSLLTALANYGLITDSSS